MFVLHPAQAAKDVDKAMETLQEIVTRSGGEVLDCRKWDDRRLAYEIIHQKRGIYVLVHFNGTGPVSNEIYRRCSMSELVLRALILLDEDGVPEPIAEKAAPKPSVPPAADSGEPGPEPAQTPEPAQAVVPAQDGTPDEAKPE